jgi:prepilin-type N-terminal cleavage/methylation domain-containing protein
MLTIGALFRPLRPEGTEVKSRGFTLIELLIVVVIVGLLAAIAIPKLSNTKQKAYVAQMKSDLKNLATAEEGFFYDSTFYTTSLAALNNFRSSTGVTLNVLEATPGGWSARATHSQTARQCVLFQGSAAPVAPATTEGKITCT